MTDTDTRWRHVYGRVHTVTRQDNPAEVGHARPGDVLFHLEAELVGQRWGVRFVTDSRALAADPGRYGAALDRMVREMDKATTR